jgi:1,4-alpha-glucan branching enzyme
LVRFVIEAKGARKVALAGDFNDWSPESTLLEGPDAAGNFVATVPLAQGDHEYMFVVDGAWVTDPRAAERRPDGFGRQNAVLRL